jgi:hypothetical protein
MIFQVWSYLNFVILGLNFIKIKKHNNWKRKIQNNNGRAFNIYVYFEQSELKYLFVMVLCRNYNCRTRHSTGPQLLMVTS